MIKEREKLEGKAGKQHKRRQSRKLKKQVGLIPLFLLCLIGAVVGFSPLGGEDDNVANSEVITRTPRFTVGQVDDLARKTWQQAITIIQKVSVSGNLIPNQFYVVKNDQLTETEQTAMAMEEKGQAKDEMHSYVTALAKDEITASFKKNGSVFSNKTAGKRVALSFDDGPYKNMTAEYLKVLKEYDVHATFFVLGQYALQRPEITQNIAATGNEVASHSWYHHNLPKMTKADIQEDFRKTEAAFYQVLGYAPNLFRAPYGALNSDVKAMAKEYGQQSVLWSIDPEDWKSHDSDQIANHILNRVSDGDIILLHENRKSTLAALPKLLQGLKDKGFEVGTVSELIYAGQQTAAE